MSFFHNQISISEVLKNSYSLQLTRAYFAFVEVLFNSHLLFVLSLDTHTFMHIVGSLESGLKGLDAGISSQVCVMNDS